ncbi:YebC-like protein [Fomitiporia mediterranea MF3/22]|uniref:YebC-like protein n=1 Tax=Fomitiporia mediterranea (strain MF3/22) TaxID=694068 RepID=UPI0004408A39|nr:YebC-like protein [Fomitiporia mediterranea MF3/22]EJD05906.1 YebC-like protein [Fomitiporia mediterranea MF3/22]
MLSTFRTLPRRSPSLTRCFTQTHICASGHNKWSKIKDKKGAADVKKSNVYARTGRDVIVAIRTGGSADPTVNHALANVLKAARAAGVPKDNVEKAIARATGEAGKEASVHVVHEAMVSGSVAVVIESMTDNGTRTVHRLREILNDYGGRFAPVMFMFDKVGRVQVKVPETDDRDSQIEAILEAASSAGGEDFEVLEDSSIVEYFCPPESLEAMTKAISVVSGGEAVVSSEYIYRAKDAPGEIDDSLEENVIELKNALLERHGDCVRVWTTIDRRIQTGDGE